MAAYYVFGIAFVVWAIFVTAAGLTGERFPPSLRLGRAMIGVSAVLIVGTLGALLATTHKEHPREAAKAEAARKKREAAGGGAPSGAPGAPSQGGEMVKVLEKEYSLKLAAGNALKAGKHIFAVANVGKIPHDLTIEGAGIKETKTPLISPGKNGQLDAELKPGKYKFYCSVPGHEQLGMKAEVTVH